MDGAYQTYLNLLQELVGCLEQLAGLAEQKATVVRQDDLMALDAVLKQEQVITLSLRGLEQRRLKLAAPLGLEGTTLSGLVDKFPPELEDDAHRIVEALRQSYKIYRSCADMARTTLELNLHQIEKTITASGIDPVLGGAGYAAPGAEPPKNMKTDFRA